MKRHRIPQALALSLRVTLLSSICWLVLAPSPQAGVANEPISPLPDVTLDPSKVALGKRLFHDKRLSHDNSVSCASCHNLSTGGVDRQQFSRGIGGAQGSINAPTVLNSGFNFVQHWNGRVSSLEDQVDIPVKGKRGMGSNWAEIISKLSQDADYPRLFAALYSDGIQSPNIKNAIATFERSLATPSRFDRYLKGDANAISADEKKGYALFKSYGCIACHQGVNVGGNMFQRFGVMGNYFDDRGQVTKADYGRYNITGREEDRFVFRVPSLRNVAITPPYFHDGSATTLEEAIDVMAKYQLGAILPDADRALIIKFLKSLTGESHDLPGTRHTPYAQP